MSKLAFYFDPLCPWAWLTSLWAREARRHRQIDIEWKFFSLTEVNQLDAIRNGPLRIVAQARREGGNEAVDGAYLALGRLFHEQRMKFETLEELADEASRGLADMGLDPSLTSRAFSDDSTLDQVLREHREAVESFDAFGVPWLVLDDDTRGFFGPVVGERLRGEAATELWDSFAWMSRHPSLYELKRGRAQLPKMRGLSDDFLDAQVSSSAHSSTLL